MTAICPWCDAPRQPGDRCARCGAIYAKAEALKAGVDPLAADATVRPPFPAAPLEDTRPEARWQGDVADAASEWKSRALAAPVALALAALFHAFPLGHFLQRTFLTMMVHEVGHAITAWCCGFAALPFLWKTMIAQSRGPVTVLLVFAANLALVVWSARERRHALTVAGALIFGLQLCGTLFLRARTAQSLITFGGDGGALVLGTLGMASFYLEGDNYLRRNALRWGFLVIGAAAFTDTFATWWQARRDPEVIAFGEIEGVGLSDPSKLSDWYGWTTHVMVQRYVVLGVVCLLALAVVYARAVIAARRALAVVR
jgi:hypothetical protein